MISVVNKDILSQKVLLFVKKVKENMSKTWEENIVKKAEELMNKKINFS